MKETANHKLRYPEPADPNALASYWENLAEDTERELDDIAPSQITSAGAGDEGKLLIVQNTGDAVFKALSGDVTVDAAGAVTIGAGKVTAGKLGSKAVETAKLNDSAVTEGKLNDAAVTSRKAKLTAGVVAATSDLSLTSSYQDVPGAVLEITPAVASILKVTAVFALEGKGRAEAENILDLRGTVRVDSTDQTLEAREYMKPNAGEHEQGGTRVQVYALPLTAAAHTIKLRAKKLGALDASCLKAGTHFLYELIAS